MLLLSTILLVAGYTLVYAGVRGEHWQQPWNLLVGAAPRIQPHTMTPPADLRLWARPS